MPTDRPLKRIDPSRFNQSDRRSFRVKEDFGLAEEEKRQKFLSPVERRVIRGIVRDLDSCFDKYEGAVNVHIVCTEFERQIDMLTDAMGAHGWANMLRQCKLAHRALENEFSGDVRRWCAEFEDCSGLEALAGSYADRLGLISDILIGLPRIIRPDDLDSINKLNLLAASAEELKEISRDIADFLLQRARTAVDELAHLLPKSSSTPVNG